MKIVLLSNVNLDPVIRLLDRMDGIDIYQSQGYGNELGTLLNTKSALYTFEPEEIFLILDVMEIIEHKLDRGAAEKNIMNWFNLFANSLRKEIVYYISDAYLYSPELEAAADTSIKSDIEKIWQNHLQVLSEAHSNVRLFGYHEIICDLGNFHAFSAKMWYMGKILHTTDCHKEIAKSIAHQIEVDGRTAKKVLLLDLDNTLWGGLAGEHNLSPIILSDEKVGLAYKNLQRVIKQMKNSGVILCAVSKNNATDALELIRSHPHMVLTEQDFTLLKINWENKLDNIVQIAKELNLGTDSFVFIDDNPAERALISENLPDVSVPDFPKNPEALPQFMVDVYHNYFEKSFITAEDRKKTEIYKANQKRNLFQMQAVDFNSYLGGLNIKLIRVNPLKHLDRLEQLTNKTNQFNLTTRRFTSQELIRIIQDQNSDIFLYRVTDRFGDNGVVAVAIVEYTLDATITEFTMSCRVMGRHIEYAILEDMENAARAHGFQNIVGLYIPTEKNKPVKDLYASAGYSINNTYDTGLIEFIGNLNKNMTRHYNLTREREEE